MTVTTSFATCRKWEFRMRIYCISCHLLCMDKQSTLHGVLTAEKELRHSQKTILSPSQNFKFKTVFRYFMQITKLGEPETIMVKILILIRIKKEDPSRSSWPAEFCFWEVFSFLSGRLSYYIHPPNSGQGANTRSSLFYLCTCLTCFQRFKYPEV